MGEKKNYEWGLTLRFLICIYVVGFFLFLYIDKKNELTELRLAIPMLAKNIKTVSEEITKFKYEIDRFESPIHLMELMRKPEFGHLKFPYIKDEIFLKENETPETEQGSNDK